MTLLALAVNSIGIFDPFVGAICWLHKDANIFTNIDHGLPKVTKKACSKRGSF